MRVSCIARRGVARLPAPYDDSRRQLLELSTGNSGMKWLINIRPIDHLN